jgi:hypothetical protein
MRCKELPEIARPDTTRNALIYKDLQTSIKLDIRGESQV